MFARIRSTLRLLANVGRGMGKSQLGLIAAGVAFYGLLAVFPAMTALVTLWGFFAEPDLVGQQLAEYEPLMPAEVYQILTSRIQDIASGPKEVLGWASLFSIGAALWAARAGVGALIGGLSAAYQTPRRGGLGRMLAAVLLTLILIAVALIAMAAVVVAPVMLSFLPLGPYASFFIDALRWIIGAGVVLLGIGLLYRFGPDRTGLRTPLLSPGSVLAATLWAMVSVSFSGYLENFGNYNEVYGSLGAVIAMLMWLYLSAFVVLLGGVLNAEIEQPESADTPVAESEPAPEEEALG